jgi:hypothetical protein
VQIEFKEKTYEKYFGHEIARLTNISFSPDQCDEHFLGFDEAFLLPLAYLSLISPYQRSSRLRHRTGMSLGELDQLTEEFVHRLPDFRFNLFVQYKRPVYLKSRGAREWRHWGCPYYRFDTMPHQQGLLEAIDDVSLGRAATVYAAPAFWQATDLWAHVRNELVVENSNVVGVGRLRSHRCYTYSGPGHHGIGHSDPEVIDSQPLNTILSVGLEQNAPIEAKEHILKTAAMVEQILEGDKLAGDLMQEAIIPYIVISEEAAQRPSALVEALITLQGFSDAFGVSLYMNG